MLIFAPKETREGETRVPMLPDIVKRLASKEIPITVERGIGAACGIEDGAYADAGAEFAEDRRAALGAADVVLRLHKPSIEETELLKEGAIHIGYADPFEDRPLLDAFVRRRASVIAMEMIPRTTLAQKMDALSSQANISGYVAVVLAAERLDKVLPMMMTPAGTIAPSRVFVIGCGVAGLQAIATAKRLGARVEAFDTRRAVEEQVKSLGGRFVKIDLGETGETKDGYARSLTDEQLARQREGIAKVVAQSDIVIAAAQVFGKTAPRIVTADMLRAMRPGTVVVDLAVESGGNVEGVQRGEEIMVNGVRLIGFDNMPGHAPLHASQMYAANLGNLLEHFWDKEARVLKLDLEDEIMDGALIAHAGEIRSAAILEARA